MDSFMKYRNKIFDEFIPLEWEDKFQILKNWMDRNPKFEREFIESVEDYFYNRGEVTESQEEAIYKIVQKFRII